MNKLKRVLSRVLNYHDIIASVIVFVMVNIFWSYFFLWYYDNYNVLGSLFSGISSLFASVVALYIAYGKHYSNLEIISKNSRVVIINHNAFPVVFTFKRSIAPMNMNMKSFGELTGCFANSFSVYDGIANVTSKHIINDMLTISSLGTMVIEFDTSTFYEKLNMQMDNDTELKERMAKCFLAGSEYNFEIYVYGHDDQPLKIKDSLSKLI